MTISKQTLLTLTQAAVLACVWMCSAVGAQPVPAVAAYSNIWNGVYGPRGMKFLLKASAARRADGKPDVVTDDVTGNSSLILSLDVHGENYASWARYAWRSLTALGAVCRPCEFKDKGARVIGGRPYRFAEPAEAAISHWERDPARQKTAVIVRVELFGARDKSFGQWDVPLGDFTRPGYDDFPLPIKGLNRLRDLPPSIWGWISRDAATGNVERATFTLPLKGLSSFRAASVVEARCTLLDEIDFGPEIDEDAPSAVVKLRKDMLHIPGRDFAMCRYEVTQDLWRAVMGDNPSQFKGKKGPVENVSWKSCQAFLTKLNAMPHARLYGFVYRLPTEEEWEWACRAGAQGPFCRLSDGSEVSAENLDSVAWFKENSERRTHPVGEKEPNAFGLYDMHGNVWEWTSDTEDIFRVVRGGCWQGSADRCEASNRNVFYPDYRNNLIGFRLVRTELR